MDLLTQIKEQAKKINKKIVLPESFEERTLRAANQILEEGIAQVVLIGSEESLLKEAEKYQLKSINKAIFVDPTLMIKAGDVDGEVAGAENATGDVLRPAFQYVKTKPGISVVSGAFIMILPEETYGDKGMLVFADCAQRYVSFCRLCSSSKSNRFGIGRDSCGNR